MANRTIPLVLLALLVLLHGQLWFGRGSVPNVSKLRTQLHAQRALNAQAALANDRLVSEIKDLHDGLEIVEEKARMELGMVRQNEIYVQLAK